MKNTIIILLFPFLCSAQGAIVDGAGNIINYTKYIDSTTGVIQTATRLKIKTDSLATALAATNAALLALKTNLADTATMLTNYARKASPTFTTPVIGAATGTSLAVTGAITSSGAGIGYTSGNGGTVTQVTNKSTGVTLNKLAGDITMINSALAAAAIVSFTLTNNQIAATDIIHVQHNATGTFGAYTITGRSAAGSAVISVRNNTAGSLSEAIVIKFIIIKSVTN